MKLPNYKTSLALAALLAGGAGAFAQSNGVPGPTDYAKFSAFVADRNIFDPARQPHYYSNNRQRFTPRQPRRNNLPPGITLVGTMSYEKGMFAFFNGNSAELKKALQVSQKIADYTVVDISASRVKLESADKKQQLDLQVGDGLRQENGKWVFSGTGELPGETTSTQTTASPASSETPTPATPASASQPNEILKRLMQNREKGN
jgi:hypothetical protein